MIEPLKGMEIERKFLLRRFPPHLEKTNGTFIRQGYISPETAEVEVRIRLAGDRGYLTMKKGRGMVRHEEEIPISPEDFESFWDFTAGARLTKTRFRVEQNDICIEIDEYEAELQPLIVAEIELPPGGGFAGMDLPHWLGAEITGIPEFANQYLARHGLPLELMNSTLAAGQDKTRPITHAGAIPYRFLNDRLEILCITSRVRKNWIVPKGVWDPGRDLHEIATEEAWEEGGVVGILDKNAVGIYEEAKNGGNERVELFALKVERVEEKWPEADFRGRRWFDCDKALDAVPLAGIAGLIKKMRDRLSID